MRFLAACILSAMAGVSVAASAPYVQIAGASSGLANTCSPASTDARVLATMEVPAGASYQYSVFLRIIPDPTGYMNMDDMMMMMGMMMGSGMSMDPYYGLLYTSPLRNGPSTATGVSLDLASPASWYTSLPGIPAHTQLMAQISTYAGAGATGVPVAQATLTWDCTTGAVSAMTNEGNAAGVAVAAAATSTAVEFYNAALDHYFVSASATEISNLDAAPAGGWARTGLSFKVFDGGGAGAVPVCRFYMPPANGDSHFYSALASECASVHATYPSFVYESPSVFYVNLPDAGGCAAGTIPLYRLWNKRADSNHRYTVDPAVKAAMIARGYVAEGTGPDAVAMCTSP